MTTSVLFMCPHSAAKSLASATYFRAAAARLGLDVSVDVAGPDPDDIPMPAMAAALESQGFTIGWQPRLVTEADTANADIMVSVGCDHDAIPTDRDIREWDAPLPSKDLLGCLAAVHDHAEALAAELAT